MAALTLGRGVGVPPAGLIERFHVPMRSVVRTWAAVARSGVPVEITSWWRDPTRNVAARGEQFSQHLVGTAMDGRSPGRSRAELLGIVLRAAAAYGVTVPLSASETSGTSVHVQGLPKGFVAQILRREPGLVQTAGAFIGPARPLT